MRRILAAALTLCACTAALDIRAEMALETVVIFSRHGVRLPTDQKALDPLSIDPWPTWSVPVVPIAPVGHDKHDVPLTQHGAQAATRMGQHYRALYVRPGFLEEQGGCPASGDLFAWADKTVRTRATADAILAGLFPGCTKPEDVSASFDPQNADVLFHPIAAGVAPLDPEAAKTAVLAAMGGSFEAAKQRLSSDFDRLAAVLHGPRPETCAKDGLGSSCRLIDLPWSISIDSAKGHSLSLKGPLQMASAVAEIIRLEYAQGMSADQVGWGRVAGAEGVKSLLALHKALYDVSLRVPPIAQRGASQILNQIALALEQGTGAEPAGGPPPAKLVLFVGHDTNMAHMQATLGVNWMLPGYPENDTVPSGALEPVRGDHEV